MINSLAISLPIARWAFLTGEHPNTVLAQRDLEVNWNQIDYRQIKEAMWAWHREFEARRRTIMKKDGDFAETKYRIVMSLAERWGIEAFQAGVDPRDYCTQKFKTYSSCRDWGVVTKVVLTAFVIREHAIWQQFFREK